jgi:hypothetical protein
MKMTNFVSGAGGLLPIRHTALVDLTFSEKDISALERQGRTKPVMPPLP